MTKPALMTFSNIEAINLYFNAKLIDFAMFSYRFNVWLTYCLMYMDCETHGEQSGVILKRQGCCLERAI